MRIRVVSLELDVDEAPPTPKHPLNRVAIETPPVSWRKLRREKGCRMFVSFPGVFAAKNGCMFLAIVSVFTSLCQKMVDLFQTHIPIALSINRLYHSGSIIVNTKYHA